MRSLIILMLLINGIASGAEALREPPKNTLVMPQQCQGYMDEFVHTINRRAAVLSELKELKKRLEFYEKAARNCEAINRK